MRGFILIILLLLVIYPVNSMATSGGVPPEAGQEQQPEDSQEKRGTFDFLRQEKPPMKPQKQKKAKDVGREEQIKLILTKKASLNNTEWEVEAKLTGTAEMSPDKVFFKEGKVGIQSALDKGFNFSNYTLTVQDQGNLVWETMQRCSRAARWRRCLSVDRSCWSGVSGRTSSRTHRGSLRPLGKRTPWPCPFRRN